MMKSKYVVTTGVGVESHKTLSDVYRILLEKAKTLEKLEEILEKRLVTVDRVIDMTPELLAIVRENKGG